MTKSTRIELRGKLFCSGWMNDFDLHLPITYVKCDSLLDCVWGYRATLLKSGVRNLYGVKRKGWNPMTKHWTLIFYPVADVWKCMGGKNQPRFLELILCCCYVPIIQLKAAHLPREWRHGYSHTAPSKSIGTARPNSFDFEFCEKGFKILAFVFWCLLYHTTKAKWLEHMIDWCFLMLILKFWPWFSL